MASATAPICHDESLEKQINIYLILSAINVPLLFIMCFKMYCELKSSRQYYNLLETQSFDFWVRYKVVSSWPGVAVFLLNTALFVTSFIFLKSYNHSPCVSTDYSSYLFGGDNIPGSFYIMVHATLIEIFGIFSIFNVVASFLLKIYNVLGYVIFPLKNLAFKKKLNKVPEDLKYIRKRVSINLSQ